MIQTLKLEQIRRNGGTQPREEIDWPLVDQYAEHMTNGDKFPPIEVYYDGFEYWLVNGFHRWHATEKVGNTTIEADVFNGDKSEAQWDSYAANKDQDTAGKRRTNSDKQRAVRAALMHPKAEKMSDVDIAEHIGVSRQMVQKHRELSCHNSTIDKPQTRIVTRGNQTYEMKLPEKKPDPVESKEMTPIGVKSEPTQPESEINPPVFLCETGRQMIEALQNESEEVEEFQEPETHLTSKRSESIAIQLAQKAIETLKEIPKKDKYYNQALNEVASWIVSNLSR